MLVLIIVLVLVLRGGGGTDPNGFGYGVDVSSALSQADFQCLARNGYEISFIRAYESTNNGRPDSAAIANIHNSLDGKVFLKEIQSKYYSTVLMNKMINICYAVAKPNR